MVDSLEVLARIRTPLPDTFHGLTDVEQRYRKRYLDLLMNEESRERRAHPRRGWWRRSAARSTTGASSRSRRRFCSRATAAPSHEPFVTHYERARRGPLPPHRHRALPQAPDRRRPREGVRDRQGLSQRGRLFKHHPEFTMLEWYEAYADYRDTMERIEQLVARAAQDVLGTTKVAVPRRRDRLRAPWRRIKFVDALEEHGLWTRDEERAAQAAAGARRRRLAGSDVVEARSTTRTRTSSSRADPADDPLRLPDRALAVRPRDRRRPDDRRALRVLRGRMELGNAFTEINDSEEQSRALLAPAGRAGGR